MSPSKYLNVRTTTPDGLVFDSKAEARRYAELLLLEKAGQVRNIRRQVTFPLTVMGRADDVVIARYRADFVYEERFGVLGWRRVIEDVKSEPTRKKESYRMKARWMAALDQPIREYVPGRNRR